VRLRKEELTRQGIEGRRSIKEDWAPKERNAQALGKLRGLGHSEVRARDSAGMVDGDSGDDEAVRA
jgi:hypothetical protein